VPPARTVADAADAFLARATATSTRRSYGQTMSALTTAHGARPLEALDGPAVVALAADNWGNAGAGHLGPTRRHAALVHRVAAARVGCRSTSVRPRAAPGEGRPLTAGSVFNTLTVAAFSG